jgi:hypothetical protein
MAPLVLAHRLVIEGSTPESVVAEAFAGAALS